MYKIVPLVTVASLVATAGGAFGAWTATAKSVELVVDGVPQTLSTHDATVADLLAAQQLDPGPADVLDPAPAATLLDGTTITLTHSRDVTVHVVDGDTTVVPTTSLTVGSLLDELGYLPQSEVNAERTAPLARSGMSLEVTPAVEVPLTVAGEEQEPVISTARTVEDLLEAAEVSYDDDDEVTPELDTKINEFEPGDGIEVDEVEYKKSEKKVDLDFETERRKTGDLPEGETKTEREGKKGTRVDTITEKFVNGKSVEKKTTDKSVKTKPVDKVVLVGTAQEKEESDSDGSSSKGGSGSDDGTGPTDGEASGNTCEASYYWQGQQTANGETFDTNAMTAAHKSLPFDSKVKVTNAANGKSVIVRINDRGPYIDGRCLDLSTAAMEAVGGTGAGVITAKWEVVG